MKQKTAMQLAIEALEQKKKSLLEMDLMGFLLPNEYVHKQNEINSIQIMLSEYLLTEREQIEEAFNAGLKTKTGIQTDDFKWGGKYYQQKYGDEPTIKND